MSGNQHLTSLFLAHISSTTSLAYCGSSQINMLSKTEPAFTCNMKYNPFSFAIQLTVPRPLFFFNIYVSFRELGIRCGLATGMQMYHGNKRYASLTCHLINIIEKGNKIGSNQLRNNGIISFVPEKNSSILNHPPPKAYEEMFDAYLPNFNTHVFYWSQHIEVRIIFKFWRTGKWRQRKIHKLISVYATYQKKQWKKRTVHIQPGSKTGMDSNCINPSELNINAKSSLDSHSSSVTTCRLY